MNPARFVLITLVRGYQWLLSPLVPMLTGAPESCRFMPTCSQYAIEALRIHGARKGARLAAVRLCRCHPWGSSGMDLVPDRLPKAE